MMRCAQCQDCGWVCEEHPGRPWAAPRACGCGAAGLPCPICNIPEDGEEPRMPEGFETDIERTAGATDGFAIHRFPDYLAGVPSGVCVMRRSPSIASALPDDVDVYLVLDDFGKSGRSWREIDEEQTDRETIITDLMRGEFNSPVRVVAFNTAEGWSRDVSEDIAEEILKRFNALAEYHSEHLDAFLDRHAKGKSLQLPLPI